MVEELTLYEDITKITEDYFGPVAPRFVSRIIANHLHKEPRQVTGRDLPELITWLKLSIALITEDAETINEFVDRLNALVKLRSHSRSR